MTIRLALLLCWPLLMLAACSPVRYEIGMERGQIEDYVRHLDLDLFVSELRVGTSHTVMLIPQAGFPRRYDSTSLANDRSMFGRFKPTDTPSNRANRWVDTMAAVELWHGMILEGRRMVEMIDDEDRDRLIDRIGFWMQDNVEPRFLIEALEPLRLDLHNTKL